jgi:cysteine-rich repeat protein
VSGAGGGGSGGAGGASGAGGAAGVGGGGSGGGGAGGAPSCSDGIKQTGEECDDGNESNTDACTNTCKNAVCGDGFTQAGEECDDGNSSNNDGCTTSCKDDCKGAGEVLDGATGTCYFLSTQGNSWEAARTACIARGPGWDLTAPTSDAERSFVASSVKPAGTRVWTAGREIGGAANDGINAWKWATGETWGYAAQGSPWAGSGPSNDSPNDCVEMFDDTGAFNDATCNTNVRYVCERPAFDAPKCRDGVLGAGEVCDDGNTADTDACLNNCQNAACGDGFVRAGAGAEQCDDENKVNGDSCASTCTNARCGNGILEPGEACDDGNGNNLNDACINNCTQYCPTSNGYRLDPVTGSCYRVATQSGTIPQSKANCAAFGTGWGLAALSTQQELNFYAASAASFGNVTFMLIDGTDTSGVWAWGNGEQWLYPQNGGAPWSGGEPNNVGGEDCLNVYPNGTLNDFPCNNPQPALCERVPASCLEIKRANPSLSGLGTYYIDPPGGQQGPMRVVCDMSTDGGGWTMGIMKNSVHIPAAGQYANFGAVFSNVGSLAILPTAASTLNSAYAGSMNLNAFPFTNVRVASYQNGSQTDNIGNIRRAAMRLNFGQNGFMLYRDTNLLYWCGGAGTFTDGGVGQVNKPIGATDDCKGHSSLGSGWDISLSPTSINQGFTVTGVGGSNLMNGAFGGTLGAYGATGRAQAIWVR